jgi:hypothetical protein
MLVALKDRYAPSDTTRIRELKVKYEKLRSSTPKSESIDDWLQKWEVTYTECLDYSISDVRENGAVWDFVRATEEINSDFAAIWTDKLLDMESSNFPGLYAIVKKFRNFKRERDTHKEKQIDLAFATFEGRYQHRFVSFQGYIYIAPYIMNMANFSLTICSVFLWDFLVYCYVPVHARISNKIQGTKQLQRTTIS